MEQSTIQKFHEFVKKTYNYDFGDGNLIYLSNGMGGEAGEVQNEVKKLYRALNQGKVQDENAEERSLRKENIKKEVLENVYGVHVNLHNLDGEVLVHPITSGS